MSEKKVVTPEEHAADFVRRVNALCKDMGVTYDVNPNASFGPFIAIRTGGEAKCVRAPDRFGYDD